MNHEPAEMVATDEKTPNGTPIWRCPVPGCNKPLPGKHKPGPCTGRPDGTLSERAFPCVYRKEQVGAIRCEECNKPGLTVLLKVFKCDSDDIPTHCCVLLPVGTLTVDGKVPAVCSKCGFRKPP